MVNKMIFCDKKNKKILKVEMWIVFKVDYILKKFVVRKGIYFDIKKKLLWLFKRSNVLYVLFVFLFDVVV